MTPCDICGNDKDYVNDLREIYQTEGIKVACPACKKILDKRLQEIRALLGDIRCSWFKRFIIGLKAKRHRNKIESIGG